MNESSHVSFAGVTTVTLIVGEEKTPFHVHLDLICDESPVFEAAFLGIFTEASNQSMDLPEDDVESVERMIQWLYFKQYELVKWSPEDVNIATENKRYWQLAKLNTLADKYHIIGLSNSIIDQLYILHSEWWPPNIDTWYTPCISMVAYVYDNTTENSSFRKLLIAWYAWDDISLNWLQQATIRRRLSDIPEFAVDLLMALSIQESDPAQKSPFEYDKFKWYHQPEEDPTRC